MEVAMGQVAEKNASDAQVKKFGARMVADHGKANSELKSIAAEEGVDLPAEKNPGKWKSDKEYMGMMVKDHEKDLADFEKEAKNGSDADVLVARIDVLDLDSRGQSKLDRLVDG